MLEHHKPRSYLDLALDWGTAVLNTLIMSTVSLASKLAGISLTKLAWVHFSKSVSSLKEGETESNVYYILELEDPIERVQGSQYVYDPETNKGVPYMAVDVVEVRVNHSIIAKYEEDFKFEEDASGKFTGAGSYEGDLFLDIASRTEHVWLVDEKFSKFGQKGKDERAISKANRFKGMIVGKKKDDQE